MKIKIVQPGWAGFTGQLGAFEFVDGISVDDISSVDAQRLAGIVGIEDADSGANPSITQNMIEKNSKAAPIEAPVAAVNETPTAEYTKESLEAIADASGIKGVREIADKFGIKGQSITELIEKILTAQGASVLKG